VDQTDASRGRRTVLAARTPDDASANRQNGRLELYKTASNPEINVDKLTHFGIGVFYKGAVHPWNNGTPEPYLKLAPEEQEALRQYLLGLADLPKNMALSVTVDSLPVVWQGMIQPYRAEPLGGFKRYVFYIPGIFFQLLIGDGARDSMPNFSADPRHLILVRGRIAPHAKYGAGADGERQAHREARKNDCGD